MIYGLSCACSDECIRKGVRYVGQTVIGNPNRRLNQHRCESRSDKAYLAVHLWMRKHIPENVTMKILGEYPENELNEEETNWISKLGTFRDDSPDGLNLTRDGLGSEITDKSRRNQKEKLRRSLSEKFESTVTQGGKLGSLEEVISNARNMWLSGARVRDVSGYLSTKHDQRVRKILRNEEFFDPEYDPSQRVNPIGTPTNGKRAEKWERAREIRRVWLEGEKTGKEIAREHGIDHTTVWNIVNNRTYKDPTYQNTRGRSVPGSVRNKISKGLKGVPKPDGFGKRGESNVLAKLSEKDALDVIQRIHSGQSGRDIARIYNVTESTISKIKQGHTWTDLPRPKDFK